MTDRDMHPSGQEASDAGQFPEQLEADGRVFDSSRPRVLKPVPDEEKEELQGVQGPGGDSRPDVTDPNDPSVGFDRIDEDPRMTTTREHFPEVHKEDPKFLEEHRVDQQDEIVGLPQGALGEEGAVLRPRISKKGAESEGS
jgi:hypothetical protein